MKKNATKLTLSILSILLLGAACWTYVQFYQSSSTNIEASSMEEVLAQLDKEGEEGEGESRIKAKKARYEYFFRMVRDPATNSIPKNIRARELNHARRMPTRLEVNRQIKAKKPSLQVAEGFDWQLAGPPAVGGRTRALGIDRRNSNIVIAGGVSGGIWKSTNGGDNWTLRTPNAENFSVTSLAQDPTEPDTWYYSSGEFLGNSASAPGASYYGTGVFRSTDNGDSWSHIPGTADDDTQFNSQFDYISRIVISPVTGTVFIASNGLGVFRSPDGNTYDDLTLGGFGEHFFADVAVASNGTLAGVLSSSDAGVTPNNPGVFVSTDDGQSWTEITPGSFPADHDRSVIAFAPSDPDVMYVFTQKSDDDSNQGVSFHRIDISGGLPGASQDRSANLPDFGGSVGGIDTQGGYNMTVTVKPDDPDFVTVGATNLFRSRDGFATAPADNSTTEKDLFWIGGYAKANNVSQYPNQHPDQHVQIYDPANPDRLWVGHDGGLSVTNDVNAQSVSWTDRNDGYIVTQFYDASIPEEDPNDSGGQKNIRLMGGTQDNGTPFFRFDGPQTTPPPSFDISSGDGGFSFFTENFIFVSNQNGIVRRWNTTASGDIDNPFAFVHPIQASDALFINPYAVDPNDETIMYYPGSNSLFRNTSVDDINNQNSSGTTQGWEELTAAALPGGYTISALEVSTLPSNTLYYAGSSGSQPPVINRLDNASSNQTPTPISIPNAAAGAYVHDIAVNPANGDDVLVVMSNYNIVGLYHTTNGGTSWTAVEGNLTGTNDPTSTDPGPSLRAATIVPSESGPIYLLATSTGVYGSQNLDGQNTQWGREAVNQLGFSVIEDIDSRFSNGDVAVGSHGRGMFLGTFQGTVVAPDNPRITIEPNEARAGNQVTITAANFQFSSTPSENEVFFADVRANVAEATSSQLTVTVPRNTLDPDAENRTILVNVTNPNGADPGPASFTVLPPQNDSMGQNFPNPFSVNEGTRIPINLQRESIVTLVIYDISGRRVDQPLKDDSFQAGTYNIPVNFSGMASGIYIYRIIAKPASDFGDPFVDSRKFTFIR
ncbi:MAG: T9SS type A sorting domain-containing protein [Balneolaceae bacterium]|nr:T9SS type A sorting domain-containing protein [Balneolaceae bacterium]